MARDKIKICLGCQSIFDARKDAKTCSTRCRKRYQRSRHIYQTGKPLVFNASASYRFRHSSLKGSRHAG